MMATELKNKTVDGILIDNYALTPFPDMMKDESIRLEKTYDHPITYGLVLSSGSEMMEECARRFVRDHAHEIFDDVSTYLVPLKVTLFYHLRQQQMTVPVVDPNRQ